MALTTGTVTGRFEDLIPGAESVTGTVTFTAEADYLLSADSTVLPAPKSVPLVASAFTVDLVATDAALNPVDWTYRVTFSLMVNGFPVKRDPFSIKVPAGQVTDLATVTPVPSYAGDPILRGEQGIQGLTGPQGIQGIQGVQGIQGLKGDPGGLVMGTVLLTADLNTIITSGVYRQDNSTNATLARNYPKDGIGGVLVVHERVSPGASASVIQQYTPAISSAVGSPWYAVRYSTTNNTIWTPWKVYNTTRVDQTAGRVIYQWDDLNNREQLIYGDTGWRDVSASLINGWTGLVKIRREGSTVTINYGSLTESTATAKEIFALPTGFANGDWIRWMVRNAAGGIQDMMVTNSHLSLYGSPSPTASNVSNGTFSTVVYMTTAPWPTVLPGTAQGTIPNV